MLVSLFVFVVGAMHFSHLFTELTFKFQAATTLSDSLGAQSTLSVNLRYADGSLLQNLVQLSNLNHVNTWVSYGMLCLSL